MIQLSIHTKVMHTKITSLFIGIVACSLAWALPQGDINNFPFRPTFSDLDPYNYNTLAPSYPQKVMRIWPYVMDTPVSPLYNSNYYNKAYNNRMNNLNNGFTTSNPYLSSYSRCENNFGKK